MTTDARTRTPSTYRCRELTALLAVLLVGAALLFTAFARGASSSESVAFIAFFAAVILLAVGYGGGMILDRLSVRHPWLTRPIFSTVLFILLPPLIIACVLLMWKQREPLLDFAEEKSKTAVTSVHEMVMGK